MNTDERNEIIKGLLEDIRRRELCAMTGQTVQLHGDRYKAVLSMVAEIERFTALVDRLPKTADGVPVTNGMKLYDPLGLICDPDDGEVREIEVYLKVSAFPEEILEDECYSSMATAIASVRGGGDSK